MPFISPMLASPMPKKFAIKPGEAWCAEEKFDGHRLIVAVGDSVTDLFGDRSLLAWSRDGLSRLLPSHVRSSLGTLPDGVYDGELIVPGCRSYGVTELTNLDKQVYVIFDILEVSRKSSVDCSYEERRLLLGEIFRARTFDPNTVRLAEGRVITREEDVQPLAEQIWERDGEGLILKRITSKYAVGKRNKDWVKIKKEQTAVLTLIGFLAGLMGPHSVAILRDDDGNVTTVKWKNYAWLDEAARLEDRCKGAMRLQHPWIGKRVRIEYQERTPDHSYRHPRWDRWED